MTKEDEDRFVKDILKKAEEKYEPAKPTSSSDGVDSEKIDEIVKNIREKVQKGK
jgi:hypothetical protein